MSFSIVPGALLPSNQPEISIDRHNRSCPLPEQGGVGLVPVPIVHQGNMPICTGVASANARTIVYYQETGQYIPFSGMFIYKMNRLFDGLPYCQSGSTLEASMQTLEHKGVCPEWLYPSSVYNCKQHFPVNGKFLLQRAAPYRITEYRRCLTLEDILQELAQAHPVVFSMIIYTDFYDARSGVVALKREGIRIGGHAMVAVQYNLCTRLLQVVQSWGNHPAGPTNQGYMYIPFDWFQEVDEETGHTLLLEAFALVR